MICSNEFVMMNILKGKQCVSTGHTTAPATRFFFFYFSFVLLICLAFLNFNSFGRKGQMQGGREI